MIDYQKLNKVTEKNFIPLPKIDNTLDQLIKSQLFIKINLKNTFNQIRINKRDEWMMAFRTRYETF